MRYPADHASLVLRPVVQTWLRRSGALSALPDAPVVPDRPRRRARRRARPAEVAVTSPATRRREAPAAACSR